MYREKISIMEQQIKELNEIVKTKIAISRIDGVGIVALRDLKKGEKLYADITPMIFTLPYVHFDKLLPEVREILLGQFPRIVSGSNFFWPTAFLQAYMNHSDTPNVDANLDIALEDISAGQELTEDYKQIPGWETAHPWLVK